MRLKSKNITFDKPLVVFMFGALLGFIVFFMLYGFECLNPFSMDWLLNRGDLQQHFIGWEFYRLSDWSFPIGVASNLAYPIGMPISFTDSIPLMAIPSKIIANTFGIDFQYFGIWSLINYIFMGAFSSLIIRRWTKNAFFIVCSAIIFLILPTFTMRVFGHTALSSQWLILAAISLLLYQKNISTKKMEIPLWTILLCIAVCIHPYFFVMVTPVLLCSVIFFHKDWRKSLIKLFIPLISSITIFWLIGGFYFKEVSADGLGEFAFDPLSLITPMDWSYFLKDGQSIAISHESLSYMGLGLICASFGLFLMFIINFKKINNYAVEHIESKVRAKIVWCFIIMICLLIISLSPKLHIAGAVVFDFQIPNFIYKIWATFRATARLFWPLLYILVILIIVMICKLTNRKIIFANVFISIVLFLQILDIAQSNAFTAKVQNFKNIQNYDYKPKLDIAKWSQAAENRKNIIFLDQIDNDSFFELSYIAIQKNMTLNTGYFARSPGTKIVYYQENYIKSLKEESLDLSNNLFITKNPTLVQSLQKIGYEIIVIDSYSIISKSTKSANNS